MRSPPQCGLAFSLLVSASLACTQGHVVPVDDPDATIADATDVESDAAPSQCASSTVGASCIFQPPVDPGAGGVLFTISGEVWARNGFPFPAANADDPVFVDGWALTFSEVLVTVDHLRLSSLSDADSTDASDSGSLVAQVDGPWAIDLQKGGPLVGKGGGNEQAVAIAAVAVENQNGGQAFDSTQSYAFGYDIVAASRFAQNVNLDANGQAAYSDMIEAGYSVMYVGTATFVGTSCTLASGASDSTNPEFATLPTTVNFRFGFMSPTTYSNCQNPGAEPADASDAADATDVADAADIGDTISQGISVNSTGSTIAQITLHTASPFWESVIQDSPMHFDQIAAQYVGEDSGDFTAALEDWTGLSFQAFVDVDDNPLPSRSCLSTYAPQPGNNLSFDPQSVPVNSDANGDPVAGLRDYPDFMTWDQSSQGRFNGTGLCVVSRNYPSPP